MSNVSNKRIAIFIVTYNAANTISSLLDRIPHDVWEEVEEVFVFDDSSSDDTYFVGLGYKEHHQIPKLKIFKNKKNLGYGGNQIRGYLYAIEKGFDIVVLLHGDGQYAPEVLPNLLEPLKKGLADAVFGSRMMRGRGALKGGMPIYKYLGNKVLTKFENFFLKMNLTEFHSGYRIYSCDALKKIPFEKNSYDFHFDTQIIIQFNMAGFRIVEKPIPTYYGDEVCHVNGIRYAKNVVFSVFRYKLHSLSIRHYPEYQLGRTHYALKKSLLSSQNQILQLVVKEEHKVLDVGCGTGEMGQQLMQQGHEVVGLDLHEPKIALSEFYKVDLFSSLPELKDNDYDVAIFADILEHLPRPDKTLRWVSEWIRDNGRIIVSLPNVAHWFVRVQMLLGKFEYADKGILDKTHLRFYTRKTAEKLFNAVGFEVIEQKTCPIPWENVLPLKHDHIITRFITRTDHFLTRIFGNFFAYQHIFVLKKKKKLLER